jgi:Phage tail assembly chaperone proteins, E, or 41 or 14
MNVEIELKYPLVDGGEELKVIKLRRPRVRDMLGSSKGDGSDAEKEVRLFADLCDLTPAVIEDMDIADYQKLQKEYSDFLD